MSIRAMVWAFDTPCPTPAAKLVLLKLADHANDEGECWPSQGRIAADCGLTRETVNRQIKALSDAGLIRTQQQTNGTGQHANRYFLRCDILSHPPVTTDHTPCDLSSHKPSVEPLRKNPPIDPPKRGGSLAGFDEWWKGYPQKVGKGAAERAWPAARKLASIDELKAAIGRYIESKPPDRDWCHPATWLNQKRWLDEPASTGELFNGSSGPSGPAPTPDELRQLIERRKMGVAH